MTFKRINFLKPAPFTIYLFLFDSISYASSRENKFLPQRNEFIVKGTVIFPTESDVYLGIR